jgi:ABC-type multidrug transport system permease subunit
MFGNSVIRAGLEQSKNLFVANYGNYADSYSLVRPDGGQVTSIMMWVLISAIIISIIFYFIKSRIPEDKKENSDTLSTIDKILLVIALTGLATCGISTIYLLIYWIVYKVQYFKWFGSLPIDAKIAHGAMSATKNLIRPNKIDYL